MTLAEEKKERRRKYCEKNKDKINEAKRAYRQENRDKIVEAQRNYYKENREKLTEQRRQWGARNPEKSLLILAKARAKKANLDFNIDVSDITIPQFCPVLGMELKRSEGQVAQNSPTVDRIIPELGYTKGNVQVISYLANRMKTDATEEQLLNFAKWIFNEYQGGQDNATG